MGEIIDIDDYRPHWVGIAVCRDCKHEWEAIAPAGIVSGLECPNCGAMKGGSKYEFGAETEWKCNCGCYDFFITGGNTHCRKCGVAQVFD
jgi:hypothetical protein